MHWLRRFFTENIALKLFSLVLAVALWAVVGSDVQTEIFLPVAVEFRNVPPGTQFEADPSRVELRVRGLRRAVLDASPRDFSVPVDMASLSGPGVKEISLAPSDVRGPVSLRVMEVAPARVTITVQPSATPSAAPSVIVPQPDNGLESNKP